MATHQPRFKQRLTYGDHKRLEKKAIAQKMRQLDKRFRDPKK